MLYDSSEANHDNAAFLIGMGGEPLISLLSAVAPVMSASAQGMMRQTGEERRPAISKTTIQEKENWHINLADWQASNNSGAARNKTGSQIHF